MENKNFNFSKNCKIIHISEGNLSSSSKQNKSLNEIEYIKNIYIYSWGKNRYGELGLGTISNTNIPSPIISLESLSINSVKSGGRNAIIITSEGDVYLCGSNIFGLLANNTKNQNNEQNQKTFKKIKYFIENEIVIKETSIAEFHCLALDENGNIFGWGGNLFNKLGKKYNILQGMPTQIFIKNKIKEISCGDYHSCALSENGILYSWGGGGESYNKGQCGHGTTNDIQKPKKVDFFIKNNLKIKRVSCGGYHTIVITESNELYSFGKGIYGQCGYGQPDNTPTPKRVVFNENQNEKYENNRNITIIDIKCGGEHSLFLSSNKKLYTCGHGYLGQLGLGNNKNISSPIIVQSLTNKNIIEIAAGWSHSLVLTNEGNIYSTGCNKYGELGIGTNLNKYNYTWIKTLSKLNIKHISAGGHHSWCLIDTNEPLREENNEPEPLLKSNFSMAKKNKRKFSEISKDAFNNSSFNDSRWNNKSFLHDKSAISADIVMRRKKISEEDEFDFNEKRKNSQNKLKILIDNYNDKKNNMSIDNLIEGINKIDKDNDNIDDMLDEKDEKNNSKKGYNINDKNDNLINKIEFPFNNINDYIQKDKEPLDINIFPIQKENFDYNIPKKINNKESEDNNIIKNNLIINKLNDNYNFNDSIDNEEEDKNQKDKLINNSIYMRNINKNNINYDCELKIIYTDLDLSHRFIRFQSSIDYNKLNNIIKNKFINKDIGNISFQFQRDDEIEKNHSITPEINLIFNEMKNKNLINLEKLSNSYTLGIVYDYNKNDEIKEYKKKFELNNIKEKKGPFFGIKIINSDEIISSENSIENFISKWIIDFNVLYNNLINKKENKIVINKPIFLELRPNIFNLNKSKI